MSVYGKSFGGVDIFLIIFYRATHFGGPMLRVVTFSFYNQNFRFEAFVLGSPLQI